MIRPTGLAPWQRVTAGLATVALLSGCSSAPRNFTARPATPPGDAPAFERAQVSCQEQVAAGKRDRFDADRGSSAGVGVAVGAATLLSSAAGAASAGSSIVAAEAAVWAGGMTLLLAPLVVFATSRYIRSGKEDEIKQAMTTCLAERGYTVGDWELTAAAAPTTASPTGAAAQGAPTNTAALIPVPGSTAAGLREGDRLTFRDSDSISGVKIAEYTWVLDSVNAERISINSGAIIMAADGTPIKGLDSMTHIYGYNRSGASSSVKFRVPWINKDQVMEISARGAETIRVAGRELNGTRYKIDGFASTIPPGRPVVGAGAPVSGEMLIDSSSGIVLRLKVKSAHISYDLHRNISDIAR